MPTRSETETGAKAAAELVRKLGLFEDDDRLLLQALTHCSFANERSCRSNERLEFLGDAVLSLILSDHLYRRCSGETEGYLTKLRAALVNENFLVDVARRLRLGEYLFLSAGEQKTGGRERKSILADAVEALIGAIYLQYGLEAATRFVNRYWEERIVQYLAGDRPLDAKTALQEFLQSQGKKPEYRLAKTEGPDHNRLFTSEVLLEGLVCGRGTGASKKEAEQIAAAEALKNLQASREI